MTSLKTLLCEFAAISLAGTTAITIELHRGAGKAPPAAPPVSPIPLYPQKCERQSRLSRINRVRRVMRVNTVNTGLRKNGEFREISLRQPNPFIDASLNPR